MQICPDPLEVVRAVRPNQQWCVTVPACYPTIFPYRPNNVDVNNDHRTNITTSSICANSQLIRRLQQKIDLYQTSAPNNLPQSHVPSFDPLKQNGSNSDRRDPMKRSDIQQDVLPTSKSRTPSLSQYSVDRKSTHRPVLSTDQPTFSSETNNPSNPFSPTQSIQSSSRENKTYSDQIDSNSIFSSNPNDLNEREPSVMSIPVPSPFSTPNFSTKQAASDQLRQSIHTLMNSTSEDSGRHFSDDHLNSAVNIKSSSSLTPSESSTSTALSSVSHTSDSEGQESSTSASVRSQSSNQLKDTLAKSDKDLDRNKRKKENQHRSSTATPNNKIGRQHSWFQRLTKKLSRKHLYPTSFHDSSPDRISRTKINNQVRLDCRDHLHMKDVMAGLEFDLIGEACQALANKQKDSQQNRLMRLLTVPSRCCRSCRTQRRLASLAQRSIDIAINAYH